jgi:hypothetical protein
VYAAKKTPVPFFSLRLQNDAKQNRDSMEMQFLLAYHHLALGHLAFGENKLRRVLEIQADEPITTRLLEVVVALRAEADTVPVSKQ